MFLSPYPGELFYSTLARTADALGLIHAAEIARLFFGLPRLTPTIEFPPRLDQFIPRLLPGSLAFKLAQIRAISTNRPKMTPGIIRSVKDSLAQASPALTAVRRKSSFVLDRLSDLTVPRGVETIPFMRGDGPIPPAAAPAEPPARKAASNADDEASRSKAPPAQPARAVPIAPIGPVALTRVKSDQGPTLLEIVKAGEEEGLSPHDSLAKAGFAGGQVWDRILDAGAADITEASS